MGIKNYYNSLKKYSSSVLSKSKEILIKLWCKSPNSVQNVNNGVISNSTQKHCSTITSEQINERKRLYEILRDHTLKAQMSNSENFDKAILSLSSAFLGASLTLIDKIVPLRGAWYPWLVQISWSSFILALFSTISSFLISQKAYKVLLNNAEKYYLEFKEEYISPKMNKWTGRVAVFNYLAAFSFFVGALSLACFIYLNIKIQGGF